MAAMEVAAGGEVLIAGGGPVFPGAGWAYVTVMSNADSKPCWKCNFCGKITAGNNHTRVSFWIFQNQE